MGAGTAPAYPWRMSDERSQPEEPAARLPRRGAEIPPSVLQILSDKTGETPRISLRQDGSGTGGGRVIQPSSDERGSVPLGRSSYQILGEIARGGMGVVLRGHDADLGRDVAMKVLSKELAARPEVVRRFVEEAQIGGQLQHPGIVPVYELGLMADERPYFTMKLVKGKTLSALLNSRKTVAEDRRRFLSIFESVCQTMAYAHSKGVIHRDLKPANIMVGAFGEVQVVDWGLAKVLGGGGLADEVRARQSELTIIETVRSGPGSGGSDSMVGSVMGTPAYMSPEQAMGALEKVDERSDVFALGAILCEILTGQPPYVAAEKERTVVLAAHARLDPARERIEQCGADGDLKELCLECLSTAPVARPRNAEEVAGRMHDHLSALERRAHDAEVAAERERVKSAEQRRRLKLTLALAATVIVSVVAIGWFVRGMEKQREEQRQQQLASARQTVDDAQAQVLALQEQGRPAEALEVARSTLNVVGSGEAGDAALSERAQRLLESAEARVEEVQGRRDLERRNAALLARCEDLRMRQIEANFGFSPPDLTEQIDGDYAASFREYGIDLDDPDLPAAMETLRSSGIAQEAALALDDWASVRRRTYGWDSYEVEAVTALAFDLDPDPLRTRMREALLARDEVGLLELAGASELASAPASTFWVLSQGLTWLKREDEAAEVVRTGVRVHPDDFLLNLRLGDLYGSRNQSIAAIPPLAAARSLRPQNGAVHALLGDAFSELGDQPAAKRAYQAVLERRPDYTRIWRFVGWAALLSGDYETAMSCYDRAVEHYPADPVWAFERELARTFGGRVEVRELVERTLAREIGFDPFWTAWVAACHPDPAQRDPERALQLLGKRLAEDDGGGARALSAFARLQLGDADGAEADLERGEALARDRNRNWLGLYKMLWAWTFEQQGEREKARTSLELGEDLLEEVFYDGETPWRDSVLLEIVLEVRTRVGG